MKTLRGDRNQCRGCGEYFNSSRAFDRHRSGEFTARRCLSADEMLERGMAQREDSFWVSKPFAGGAQPQPWWGHAAR